MTTPATILTRLEETICKLESMGTILVQLTTNEEQEPDMTSLADLGRLIQMLAMEALEMVCDLETTSENPLQPKKKCACPPLKI